MRGDVHRDQDVARAARRGFALAAETDLFGLRNAGRNFHRQRFDLARRRGDILITVHVAPHPYFHRHGNNLEVRVPVTLAEAALGAKVDVPRQGHDPRCACRRARRPARSCGSKGHGVAPKGGDPGDLFAEIQIVLPKTLDDESREEIQKLDERWNAGAAAESTAGFGAGKRGFTLRFAPGIRRNATRNALTMFSFTHLSPWLTEPRLLLSSSTAAAAPRSRSRGPRFYGPLA